MGEVDGELTRRTCMRVAAGAGVVEKDLTAVGKRCCKEGRGAAGRRKDGARRCRSIGIAIVVAGGDVIGLGSNSGRDGLLARRDVSELDFCCT